MVLSLILLLFLVEQNHLLVNLKQSTRVGSVLVNGAPTDFRILENDLQARSELSLVGLEPRGNSLPALIKLKDNSESNNSNNNSSKLLHDIEIPTVGAATKADRQNETTTDSNSQARILNFTSIRVKRTQDPDCEFAASIRKPAIYGLRCDTCEVTDDGGIIVKVLELAKVYLIGRNLHSNLSVALTPSEGYSRDDCTHTDRVKSLKINNISSNIAEVNLELAFTNAKIPLYFCVREAAENSNWYHQGSEPWMRIYVHQDFLPLYMKIITIACLLGLSGLFSGLNLGLMALDKNELQVIMKCGSEDERRYARIIEPVRRRGNYLLCSILFSNTLVNSTISVFLEDLSGGLVAITTSTILIVLFGEILPQAFCSRHGLAVGAKTVHLTNFCMFITFPLSYPVSKCLDWALGEEIGHAYDRERLMEFIRITSDTNNLETDEVNIISGALKIKHICIKEVMTRIEDVYMLNENAILDFDTIQEIVAKGYSRIPVHSANDEKNIVAVLLAKDLALVDPDDKTPVQTMTNFYNHPVIFLLEDDTLNAALNEFKTGRSHMAIVRRLINDGDKDPYYENTGIVTLEDVIEEIIQMEINDETDVWTDNRRKRRRKDVQVRQDFAHFTNLGTGDSGFNVVTPQLCMAAYLYLASKVEPFSPEHLSDNVLRRLLSQKIFYKVKIEDDDSMKRLYTAGMPADYFIMVLEGRVHVICGQEQLSSDGGPFMVFGKPALYPQTLNEIENDAAAAQTNLENTSPARKESTMKVLSRRESLAKLVLSTKKVADVEQTPTTSTQISTNIGPTGEVITERGLQYFIPDYTVDIIATTSYLKVTRNDYLTALKATQLERASTGDSRYTEDSIEVPLLQTNAPSIALETFRNDSAS